MASGRCKQQDERAARGSTRAMPSIIDPVAVERKHGKLANVKVKVTVPPDAPLKGKAAAYTT